MKNVSWHGHLTLILDIWIYFWTCGHEFRICPGLLLGLFNAFKII